MFLVLLSVIPIFFGFVYFGYSLFQQSSYFESIQAIVILLASISTGDEVINGFIRAMNENYFWGFFFVLLYSATFYLIVQNVFVFVITSTFMKVFKQKEEEERARKKLKAKKYLNFFYFFSKKFELTMENMRTTAMLRLSDRELIKQEVKKQSHYMFKANMEKIKTEIMKSTSSKHAKGMDKIIGRSFLVTEAINELQSTLVDLRIEAENIGPVRLKRLNLTIKKYLDFLDLLFNKYRFPGVTLAECKKEGESEVELPFESHKFEYVENKVEEDFKINSTILNEESNFSFSEFGSDMDTYDNLTLESVEVIDAIELKEFDIKDRLSFEYGNSFRSERSMMKADVLTRSFLERMDDSYSDVDGSSAYPDDEQDQSIRSGLGNELRDRGLG